MIDLLISALPLVGLFIAGYVLCLHTRDIDTLATRIERLEERLTRLDIETRPMREKERQEREARVMFVKYRNQREQDRKDGPHYGLDA